MKVSVLSFSIIIFTNLIPNAISSKSVSSGSKLKGANKVGTLYVNKSKSKLHKQIESKIESPPHLQTSELSYMEGKKMGVNALRGGEKEIDQQYSKLRRAAFPIYGTQEITKFLLIGSIKFFVILALTLSRDTKDTLVVTQCGAEAIAFLKIYGVLPAAATYIAFYTKISSILGKKALFFTTCIPFFIFFILFDLILYPNAESIQPSLSIIQSFLGLSASGKGGLHVIAKIISNWTSALYYVVAEIYSSVSVGLLFWQFANDVVPVHQAKRFYPLFAQMSGFAPILAGQYVVRYTSKASSFAGSLDRITVALAFSGCMICVCYQLSSNYVAIGENGTAKKKSKKQKMTMMESAKFLASSQYLRLMTTLVLGYGLSINFTEIMWKSLVKKQYPDPLDYQRFMGNFSSAVGFATTIVIFLGVQVIRVLGWRIGAIATPAIMSALAVPFFACIFAGLDSPEMLKLAVLIGTVQSLVSKTGKYALFDPTTQMAYIPLDEDSKVKGKAAIDVLGSRIGKSGGSLIQQFLVMTFGNIIDAAPVVMIIFYSVLFGWIAAANKLSSLFHAKTAELDEEEKKND